MAKQRIEVQRGNRLCARLTNRMLGNSSYWLKGLTVILGGGRQTMLDLVRNTIHDVILMNVSYEWSPIKAHDIAEMNVLQ